MTSPRPSRTARWVIGSVVTALLALVALTFGMAALLSQVPDDAFGDGPDDARRSARATATVLDVDAYDFSDHPVAVDSDWADDDGYAVVDIDFTGDDGGHEVTVIDWPQDRALPVEGDQLAISYDPADPENWPGLTEETVADAPGPLFGNAASDPPAWPGITALVAGLLAVGSFVATIVWARRVRVAPAGQPPVWNDPWNQPTAWNQPPGWTAQPPPPAAPSPIQDNSPTPVRSPDNLVPPS